ncbi:MULTISPECIES: hypothetical protein [unclassified Bradyrhizobium]
MDLFVVPTIGFDLLYAFVIVRLDRRDLVWINITRSPTADWVARHITEAFPWGEAQNTSFAIASMTASLRGDCTAWVSATILLHQPRRGRMALPNFTGSIRRECLDIIVLGEVNLPQILRSYGRYYNDIRTHRSLDKDAPAARPIQRTGSIRSLPILGGLHHHYARA